MKNDDFMSWFQEKLNEIKTKQTDKPTDKEPKNEPTDNEFYANYKAYFENQLNESENKYE